MAKAPKRTNKGTSGARISHAAQRRSWFRTPRFLYSAVVGGVLVIGILVGTGLGLWLSPSRSGSSPQSSVAINQTNMEEATLPKGPPLPVIVQGSETAKRLYEESLANQPEALRPDPNEAPKQAAKPALVVPTPAPLPPMQMPPIQIAPMSVPENPPLEAPAAQRPSAAPDSWLANAVPMVPDPDKPMIALIFDDLGIDQGHSREAIDLPGPMTMAFLTYGHNLQDLVSKAKANGHEILVHVPMAPLDLSIDPGPNALQRELGTTEILRRLDWDLSQFSGYVGINNHMGSRFTADPEGMRLVLNELKRRGLIFVDSVTTSESKGYSTAAALGMPYAVRDVFLDNTIDAEAIRKQLTRVEATAKRQGYAIAIGHPHPETLAVVTEWLKTIQSSGFQLVPVSTIVRMQQATPRS
ncbi:MAG: divergent polysaccharide deacetylase family protein [Alphaproteobacteria bacterium]|nr:divergent polysaccharide deacetylase family protein [Alphaproteobacteria bacterium]